MNTNTAAIVRLAWTRGLGLPDDALAATGAHHRLPDDAADAVRLVRLWDTSVLTGPTSSLDRIAPSATLEPGLESAPGVVAAALARDIGATRPPAVELLYYLDDYGDERSDAEPLISHDDHDAEVLGRRCPPDDVNEAATGGLERRFTLLDGGHSPLACAGYAIHRTLLADLRVLTEPGSRRAGAGSTVCRLAAHDALDAGLIAQARIHPDNHAARRLATTVGFAECGWQITVTPPH